ncbi:mate-domain-containing protein [Dichotomocladium elegans]|nr:mate-domain-containing protein [Dichotomocladium elegans]
MNPISESSGESTPLIAKEPQQESTATIRSELSWLFDKSMPVVGSWLLHLGCRMGFVAAYGHLGPDELAGSALGSMIANVTSTSLIFGALNALDTLCSQAWTGAKDKRLLGLYLQKAVLVVAAWHAVLAPFWFFAEPLLVAIGQEPHVAHLAGILLRYSIPTVPALCCFEALRKYLQAQGNMSASTGVLMVCTPVTLVLTYTLTFRFGMGFEGVALMQCLSQWAMLLCLAGYTRYRKYGLCWGDDADGFWQVQKTRSDWCLFLRYAAPGMVSTTAEWWFLELCSLAASYLSTQQLAAQSIMMVLDQTLTAPGWGVSAAAATRIGHAMGSNQWTGTAVRTIQAAVVLAAALASLFALAPSYLAPVFSTNQEILAVVVAVLPLFSCYLVIKAVFLTLMGVLRGIGRPDITTYINLVVCYLIGVPLSYMLTFQAGWDLFGLWTGLALATLFAAIGHLVYIGFIDWTAVAQKAQNRLKSEQLVLSR